jgi:hypothetical protein
MKVIYKYPMQLELYQTIELPENARILSIQLQSDQICMWVLTDTEMDFKVSRVFMVIGTGTSDRIGEFDEYLASVQQGVYVWHIFEEL